MKPRVAKGTRDFLPSEVLRRKFIFNTIEEVFKKFSYQQIETPTMELLETLTGKYGEEGDRLLFKILNNGDYLSKADQSALEAKDSKKLIPSISKRGLRYDLTVPFARFVVMHQNELQLPFKRYQIQPVWRAERPQKGRYQEFYQCDVDVVGSTSLMYEAELIQIYDEVFARLDLDVTIKINNRKILYGIAESAGIEDQFMDMTIAIDKLDKIGVEGVIKELGLKQIPDKAINHIMDCLQIKSLDPLETKLSNSQTGLKGIEELRSFHNYIDTVSLKNTLEFDISLARGLNYYTGCIMEVKANNADMGSIGGGGRYDDLTSIFGMKGVSGVGISFGAERIYDVMMEKSLFPADIDKQVKLLVITNDSDHHVFAYTLTNQLRNEGISADIYPNAAKMSKQFKYADQRNIPYVLIIGEEEIQTKKYSLKDMKTGEQHQMELDELVKKLK